MINEGHPDNVADSLSGDYVIFLKHFLMVCGLHGPETELDLGKGKAGPEKETFCVGVPRLVSSEVILRNFSRVFLSISLTKAGLPRGPPRRTMPGSFTLVTVVRSWSSGSESCLEGGPDCDLWVVGC